MKQNCSSENRTYEYGVLDPRNTPEARDANDHLLSGAAFGIEVSRQDMGDRCTLANVDPQHTDGLDVASVQVCNDIALPEAGARLVTVRPDLDSVGAMALLECRASGNTLDEHVKVKLVERIKQIALADQAAQREWIPSKLPTRENPWPESNIGVGRELAPVAAMCMDFLIPIETRVQLMRSWLVNGDFEGIEQYTAKVEDERLKAINALECGEITVEEALSGVAVVHSSHPGAMQMGYALAPVVIAVNEQFKFSGGEPHKKVTIAQFREGTIAMNNLNQDLSSKENGWGGSASIIGSPRGKSTTLGSAEIIDAVSKHLLHPSPEVQKYLELSERMHRQSVLQVSREFDGTNCRGNGDFYIKYDYLPVITESDINRITEEIKNELPRNSYKGTLKIDYDQSQKALVLNVLSPKNLIAGLFGKTNSAVEVVYPMKEWKGSQPLDAPFNLHERNFYFPVRVTVHSGSRTITTELIGGQPNATKKETIPSYGEIGNMWVDKLNSILKKNLLQEKPIRHPLLIGPSAPWFSLAPELVEFTEEHFRISLERLKEQFQLVQDSDIAAETIELPKPAWCLHPFPHGAHTVLPLPRKVAKQILELFIATAERRLKEIQQEETKT